MFKRLFILTLCLFTSLTYADDKTELNQLLNDFLANTIQNDLKNHSRFWAEDLIYTSSAGKRFGKANIIDGIKADADKGNEEDKEGESVDHPKYWAEDTDIRLYGTTAIVAFKLGGEWQEEGKLKKQYYYNTGTFLKRDGKWAVIAWQATKIPQE